MKCTATTNSSNARGALQINTHWTGGIYTHKNPTNKPLITMSKPRVAVKINPVTGKMEAADDEKDGMKRDGCMRLPSKYLTAALDAGLGGANGTSGFCFVVFAVALEAGCFTSHPRAASP